MRYRILTPGGDMTFGGGQLNFYDDTPTGVAQLVQTSLLLWLGEWYLDLSAGTPYMQSILGKHSQDVADTAIQNRVTDLQVIDSAGNLVNPVTDIRTFTSTFDGNTRKMVVSMNLDTIYGPTTVEIQNYAIF